MAGHFDLDEDWTEVDLGPVLAQRPCHIAKRDLLADRALFVRQLLLGAGSAARADLVQLERRSPRSLSASANSRRAASHRNSASMAASSSGVPSTLGPLNHFRAETAYQMPAKPMTTPTATGV